jgi:hypothetical protein
MTHIPLLKTQIIASNSSEMPVINLVFVSKYRLTIDTICVFLMKRVNLREDQNLVMLYLHHHDFSYKTNDSHDKFKFEIKVKVLRTISSVNLQ